MLFPQRSIKWTFRAHLHLPAQVMPFEAARPVPSHQRSSECRQTKMYIFFGIGMLHRLLMIPANHCSASVGDTNIAVGGDAGANTVYGLLPSDASTLAVNCSRDRRSLGDGRGGFGSGFRTCDATPLMQDSPE